ncbi:DUF5069 domain-containing protein [Roseibacillus persicicus]|uniref:DUF5069 domain-containing protein n=1 Tax=Roseibacillus persicicus TaxID=454148 RepID=UPI00280DF086|nr:DUF5069 domain-containing protein [Roseibacillus persicicus]MDQ8191716.1 DUF5069 domain-containing protein [Roseibacillus persicicus]
MSDTYPCSPRSEIDGLPYFPRMVEKIRLFAAGELHPELHANLGKGMDLWICQFLGVDYETIKEFTLAGAPDSEVLAQARAKGTKREEHELAWFRAYILNRGFRDDLSEKLASRIEESGFQDKKGIYSFCDYIDADEGRL